MSEKTTTTPEKQRTRLPETVTTRRRRPRKLKNDDTAVNFALQDKENSSIRLDSTAGSSSDKESSKSISSSSSNKAVLKDFIAASKRTSQADFWKKHNDDNLSKMIVDTSCSLSPTTSQGGFSLLLEEHTTELLQVCRKLIVEATSKLNGDKKDEKNQKSNNNHQQQQTKSDCLTVAIHTFRALCRNNSVLSSNNPSKQESAMRLLYHAIATATDQVVSLSKDSSKTSSVAAAATITITTAIHQSLAAFEALGYLLRDYMFRTKAKDDDDDSKTSSTIFQSEGDGKGFNALFPVPQERSRKKDKNSKAAAKPVSSGLSMEQVSAIGIQATRAIAKVLLLPCAQQACSLAATAGSSCMIPHPFLEQFVNDNNNNNSILSSVHEAAIHLLRFTTLQWMLFQQKRSSSSHNKDFISHCKQNHVLLWDAAATVSSQSAEKCLLLRQQAILAFLAVGSYSSSENITTPKNDNNPIIPPHKIATALHAKNFDAACTFGWKAAVTFVRQTSCPCPVSESTSASSGARLVLSTFHETVGAQLDRIASNRKLDVLSYVEYCAHRARHLGPSWKLLQQQQNACKSSPTSASEPCMFSHLPYRCNHLTCCRKLRTSSESQHQSSAYGPTAALSFVVLYLDHELQQVQQQAKSARCHYPDNVPNAFFRSAQQIVESFRKECETAKQEIDAAGRLRLFKLYSVESLLRTIYRTLETDAWKSHGAQIPTMLELAATVLVDCLGPVAFDLAFDANLEPGKRPWDVAVQCFLRGIGILEALLREQESAEEQDKFLQRSHAAQEHLVKYLCGKRIGVLLPPTTVIEMAAKNLFNIGRQRLEIPHLRNGNHASLPLLSGIQLFTEVTRHASGPTDSCQLSARWAFLAKTLMSSGESTDAAIVALVSALAYVGVEQASQSTKRADDGRDEAVDLFVFVCSLSKDNLPTGLVDESGCEKDQVQGLISKLINIIAERERSSFTPSEEQKTAPFTAGQAIECLFDDLRGARPLCSSFEQSCNVPFSISALIQVMFAKGTLPSEVRRCPQNVMSQKIRLSIGILVRFALSLQHDAWGEGLAFDAAFTEYDFLVRLVASHIRKLLAGRDSASSSAVILGAFYIMASVCLVSRHPSTSLDGWSFGGSNSSKSPISLDARKFAILMGFAKKYAEKAAATLASVSGDENDWAITASAMLPALGLYQLRLSHIQQKSNSSSFVDLGSLSLHVTSAVDALTPVQSDSTLLELSRRCFVSILSRYYDWLSLRGERLNALQIATWNRNLARSLSPNLCQWLEATTLSQAVRETYLPSEASPEGDQAGETTIALVEVEACRLRSQLLGARAIPELRHTRTGLCALLERLQGMERDPDLSEAELLMPWVRSTVVSGVADAAHLAGEHAAALRHYRACLRECQLATASLSREKRLIPGPSGVSIPFWESVPVSSAILRYRDRQVDCLLRISLVHESLGDYRKATTYAISAVERTGMEWTNSSTFPAIVESIKQAPCESGRERQARRLLLQLKARATAFDVVQHELVNDVLVTRYQNDESPFSCDHDLERILDSLACNSLVNNFSRHQPTASFIDAARSDYEQLVHRPQVEQLASLLPGRIASSVSYDLKLAEARAAFSQNGVCEVGHQIAVRSVCKEIVQAPDASTFCRAEAFYLLGLLDLACARESGALAALWHGSSNLETATGFDESFDDTLEKARASFSSALSMLGPTSKLFNRSALRCLALVLGPESDHDIKADSTCILIHTSIGSGSRQQVARAHHIIDSGGHENADSIHDMFVALDTGLVSDKRRLVIDNFLHRLNTLTPPDWRYVACTICPTGELLVSSLSRREETSEIVAETTCIFPSADYGELRVGAYDQILKPLDSIIRRMDGTLRGLHGKNTTSMEEDEKRAWWDERKALDLELRALIETVEEDFFSSDSARSVLVGASSENDECRGNLASLFEAATEEATAKPRSAEPRTLPEDMKVAELKEELTTMGFDAKTLRRKRKAELVVMLRKRRVAQNEARQSASNEDSSAAQEKGYTILVLDENLHRFPFEGLPILHNKIVCRVPSLPFAVAKLAELAVSDKDGDGRARVNGKLASYVVDPESNLSATTDRLMPLLESLGERNGGSWKGVTGEIPASSFIEESLLTKNGLFLYFGHGCGKLYYSRKQIESLMQGDDHGGGGGGGRRIQSSIVLMGCSSGRLVSVNRKSTQSTDELPIYYDPEGTALSYLSAGAPCVIGNLWDVTDGDIDRFSMQMLEQFFDEDENDKEDDDDISLAECVAKSRSVCKMRYLVGCAPVCYGIPVYRER